MFWSVETGAMMAIYIKKKLKLYNDKTPGTRSVFVIYIYIFFF